MANWIPLWLHKLSSPPMFYRFAGTLQPWAMALALLLGAVALYGGLVLAPADYQQGDAFRIIYIHVPSAWMSMFIYAVMGVASFIALVWRSEEHTSELQSLMRISYAVFCLKKKNTDQTNTRTVYETSNRLTDD